MKKHCCYLQVKFFILRIAYNPLFLVGLFLMAEQNGETPTQEAIPTMSVEEIIEEGIGRMNCAQIMQAILASIPPFFDNQQTFISIFTDAHPPWHCTNQSSTACSSTTDICTLSNSEWAWDRNVHHSMISEWHLECATSFLKGLPATSYFVGCLLGGFALATLGDSSLGRKNLVFISCLVMSLAALASAFSPNVWVYSVFRFISGVGRVSITVSAFVLLLERVGKCWRGQMVLFGFLGSTFGLLSVTAIAYLTRDSSWRALYLCTSIPAIICCTLVHFFLCESPRWLFMQGREKDAIAVLKRIGCMDHISSTMLIKQGIRKNNENPFSSIKILVKRGWAVKRLLATMMLSFGVGLMYFGMLLGVGGIGLNIYVLTTFNALISLLSALLTFLFWIQCCNRRTSVLGFCIISGASSIISSIIGHHGNKGIKIGLEMTSLFCASMVFNILFMYVVEMFPTCIRNSGAALSRLAILLASVFVPILVVIGKRNDRLSHIVFGVGILLSGLLVVSLPETRGKVLCDTIEEQEVRDKDGGCMSNCI